MPRINGKKTHTHAVLYPKYAKGTVCHTPNRYHIQYTSVPKVLVHLCVCLCVCVCCHLVYSRRLSSPSGISWARQPGSHNSFFFFFRWWKKTMYEVHSSVCVCVFFPSILDIKFVRRTSRGHTGGRSHRIFNPPSFCGACLDFCREKDSAIPFPRRP